MTLKTKQLHHLTIDHVSIRTMCRYNLNTDHIEIHNLIYKPRKYKGTSKTNKTCTVWLGNRSEIILMNMFDKVERMPYGTPGYDFICGLDYKIDCKSSCLTKNRLKSWMFRIRQNKMADFFLCLALDNRNDMNPLYIWLIPAYIVNNLTGLRISESTLDRWSKYERPLDKVLQCCNTMKGE